MSVQKQCPPAIRGDTWTEQILRDFIWKPANLDNDWTVFVIVGRENSGKSLTCASILKAVDPRFTAKRAHFRPVPFLKDIAFGPEREGVAVMGDEFGVGFGKRTWHDREQVEANQALQTARDDNRIIGVTVPRLEELDSQLIGRLHVMMEAVKKKDGEWVELKFKVIDPSRDGAGKDYKKYPEYHIKNIEYNPERIRISMPPQELINEYEEKKANFKEQLYSRVIDRFEEAFEKDNPNNEKSPKEIAQHIAEKDAIEEFLSVHGGNGTQYINKQLIRSEFNLTESEAGAVKGYLEKVST